MKGLTLEEREGPGKYAARADSGLEIPPTPFAVTHPELAAVIRESVRRFSQQSLNGERGMDVVLSPPWGTAWLLDVEGLPDDEVEEQVAWELQQRLDSPLEEHIYAWHPQNDQVYAVVIRPEMLEFWDRIFQESGVYLGSITLETGLVDPATEASADLLPLYHLWADRHRKSVPRTDEKPPKATFAFREESDLSEGGDEILEEELREFDADQDRVRALDPQFENEEDADDALGAIMGKDGSIIGRRKKRRGFRIVVLILLFVVVGAVWQRDRIARRIPGGAAIVQKSEQIAKRGLRKFRHLAGRVRSVAIERTAKKSTEVQPVGTPAEVKEKPAVGVEQTPASPEQQLPVEQPLAEETQLLQGEEVTDRTPPPASRSQVQEQRPVGRVAGTGSRVPAVTVPLQTVELPPVKPSTGLALKKLYSLADAAGVEIETLILQGPGLRFEVGGDEEAVDTWANSASQIPGGGASRVEPAALLAPGVLVEMDLQGVEERSLTLQQFAELGQRLGLREVEPSLWAADRAGLASLFKAFEQEHARPFRLSIHHLRGDTYHLVVIP
ncbi:MAG: hypothetical protein V2A56_08850 [bacterium]